MLTLVNSYTDWKQVAGYFDGDGSSDFKIGKKIIFVRLHFTENYRPQLEAVQKFLNSQGIETETITDTLRGASRLSAGRFVSVREMAIRMLPHTFKKREELQAILDYFGNRITGTQLIGAMNRSVRLGNRTGKIRIADVPFTREQGQSLDKAEKAAGSRRRGINNQILSDEVLEQIRSDYIGGVATNGELAKKHGVRPATISRAVFGRNRKE
jgi:hypothetical protein